eukprot:snap_masked-scaffold_6-processed-gene-12.24-mRNA-1 protein AED:1.00 eAED:1.00 QI:0/0/0/0/1/1/2/0/385
MFLDDCPDLLEIQNGQCVVSWFDSLLPYSLIVTVTLAVINTILALISLVLLTHHSKTIYKRFFNSCARSAGHTGLDSRVQVTFQKRLLFLIYLGSFVQQVLHVIFFSLGMFLKFRFPLSEAYIAGYCYTTALAISFSTSFCVTTLIQITIASPLLQNTSARTLLSSIQDRLNFRLTTPRNFWDISKFLGLNLLVWFLIWIILGIFESPVVLFRVFLGALSVPLLLQAIILRHGAATIVLLIDNLNASSVCPDEMKQQYTTIRNKMQAYSNGMGFLLTQNGFMGLFIAITPVLHNKIFFFVVLILFGVSLAGFSGLVLYLFSRKRYRFLSKKSTKVSFFRSREINVPIEKERRSSNKVFEIVKKKSVGRRYILSVKQKANLIDVSI